jgi:hypothetical protein
MAVVATNPNLATIEQVIALAREYVIALDARRYSHAQNALTRLADTIRALPEWLVPPVVEPAAEVERTLVCGAKYRLANEDGCLVFVVKDDETSVAPALVDKEATQLRADLARVLAAMGGK